MICEMLRVLENEAYEALKLKSQLISKDLVVRGVTRFKKLIYMALSHSLQYHMLWSSSRYRLLKIYVNYEVGLVI